MTVASKMIIAEPYETRSNQSFHSLESIIKLIPIVCTCVRFVEARPIDVKTLSLVIIAHGGLIGVCPEAEVAACACT